MGILAVNSPATWSSGHPCYEPAKHHWYAAYTCPHHEKRVADQLAGRSVEHFLPTYQSVRRWKDRKKVLKLPLFPGYIFVRMDLKDRLRILEVPGVVRLISFNGLPTALQDDEIDTLREGLAQTCAIRPYPYIVAGRHVLIVRGPFQGLEGVLIRQKKNLRVVLSLDLIRRSVLVDVDIADLEICTVRLS